METDGSVAKQLARLQPKILEPSCEVALFFVIWSCYRRCLGQQFLRGTATPVYTGVLRGKDMVNGSQLNIRYPQASLAVLSTVQLPSSDRWIEVKY
jgi:hypothetical protein